MEQDGVNVALELVQEELAFVVSQLNKEGEVSFRSGRYDSTERLSKLGRELTAFREEVESLQRKWNQGFDRSTRLRVKPNRITARHVAHKKAPKTVLSVKLADGKTIAYSVAAETFVATIEAFGIERVRALGMTMYGEPLISDSKHDRYTQYRSGDYYVMTHSNTETKKKQLEEIAGKLGERIAVEIV